MKICLWQETHNSNKSKCRNFATGQCEPSCSDDRPCIGIATFCLPTKVCGCMGINTIPARTTHIVLTDGSVSVSNVSLPASATRICFIQNHVRDESWENSQILVSF